MVSEQNGLIAENVILNIYVLSFFSVSEQIKRATKC